MKEGENGRGMASRWYPGTLRKRILAILEVKCRMRFVQGDGVGVIRVNGDRPEVAFFVDPPYTVAGRRLYTSNQVGHGELFEILAGVRGDFLVTYDDAKEIRQLAAEHQFDTDMCR